MHELSIVTGIIELSEKVLSENKGNDIQEIELEIGKLSGVDYHAFEFAWETAKKDTILEKAKKTILKTEAKALCLDCKHKFTIDNIYDACPKCQQYFTQILSGKELKVLSLTIN